MSSLGLKRGTVKLISDHEEWARLFEIEKKLLLKILGKNIIAIEHVGSTAIPGVPAKPIIDIRISIPTLDDTYIKKLISPLEKIGYTYMHNFGDRHFFAKGPEEKRTHHISFVKENSQTDWKDVLFFRDYLRKNETARDEYSMLKQKLAKQFSEDRASYTKAKEEFIEKIIKKQSVSYFIKTLYWAPRILSILFILFLAVFSLDVFDGNYGFWGTALALFMHNIPSLVLTLVLIISWKYEIVGGIAFILAGLLYIALIATSASMDGLQLYMITWPLIISLPAFVVGGLFLLNWKKNK